MTMTQERTKLRTLIEEATADPHWLESAAHRAAVEDTIAAVDRGRLRMAERTGDGWTVNGWIQQAILLYFQLTEMQTMHAGPIEFYDRIPLKQDLAEQGIRVIPGGIARYGAHIEPGAVLMPGFVNIGAYVASGSMVDTWATVGSGAQIGRNVHLSGGVGIGGVLEPVGARPVIIEDDAFIGSRCIIVEGVIVEEGAVLASQVSLSASTHIIDVTGDEPVTHKGRVPAGSIVIPGTRPRAFAAGEFEVACALIIGRRNEQTDQKLQPMDAARAFGFSV
ncbi:2,3,4,5-tetrahydropyridine-2,6-dicarboxylate N-succinyltransferase [Kribbella sp. NPDC049227]|uniref:2,3,4,5-tetrahydropyridine-2,6-dicarboxylate N-succinyltransferase n=1 Tax=Kribbella sp. NPDC049227 TaxID=3364113 RepID=UPI00372089A9